MTSLTLGIVLDRSGSMHNAWDDTVGAVRNMLDEQAAEGETVIVPVVFDDRIEVLDATLAGQSDPLEGISPRGTTALYDAIYAGIKATEAYVPETDKTALLIATDGLENSSREHTRDEINELISQKRDEGWEIIFIGANQDSWATGSSMGIKTTMDWNQTPEGTQLVYRRSSAALTSYRNQ